MRAPKRPTIPNEAVQISERTQEHIVDHLIDLVDAEAAHITRHRSSQQSIQIRETAAIPGHRHPDQRSDLAISLLVANIFNLIVTKQLAQSMD